KTGNLRLTQEDLKRIKQKGINEKKVEEQLEIFKRGNLPVDIIAAATPGKGIYRFSHEEREELEAYYDSRKMQLEIIKFIPASGAATRMCKALHGFLADFDPGNSSMSDFVKQTKDQGLKDFIER